MRAGLPGAVCYEYKCYPPADCCAAAFTAEYEYAGTQRLRAVQVPNPVRMRALALRIRPGEAATFTAEIDGILRKPDGTPGGIRWVWAPNDTLAEHQRNLATVSLASACSGKTTCTYTPLQSGRMVVEADVEGRVVKNVSEVVWRRGCEMFASPPSDALLLDPVMLNTLEDLAKRTRFTSPVRERREHGKYILHDGERHFTREFEYLQHIPYPMPNPVRQRPPRHAPRVRGLRIRRRGGDPQPSVRRARVPGQPGRHLPNPPAGRSIRVQRWTERPWT